MPTETAPSTGSKDAPGAPKIEPSNVKKEAIRRHKGGGGWCVADDDRAYFDRSVAQAFLSGVTFDGTAKPMRCVSDYDSTGEAIGVIMETAEPPMMPQDAKRTQSIIYDRELHVFRASEGEDPTPIESADYLLLFPNGDAIAGWKEK